MKALLKHALLALAAQAPVASFAQRAGPANTVLKMPASGTRAKFGFLGVENFSTRSIDSDGTAVTGDIARRQLNTINPFTATSSTTIAGVTLTAPKNPVVIVGSVEFVDCSGPPGRIDLKLVYGTTPLSAGPTLSLDCATAGGSSGGSTIIGLAPADSLPTGYYMQAAISGATSTILFNPRVFAFELH